MNLPSTPIQSEEIKCPIVKKFETFLAERKQIADFDLFTYDCLYTYGFGFGLIYIH